MSLLSTELSGRERKKCLQSKEDTIQGCQTSGSFVNVRTCCIGLGMVRILFTSVWIDWSYRDPVRQVDNRMRELQFSF